MCVCVCVCVRVYVCAHVCICGCVCTCKCMEIFVQELFCSSGGIQAIVPFLRIDIKKFSCGLGHHRLLLAAVDCIWYDSYFIE